MKLYLGSHKYRPDGYLTVDIDPAGQPDILADVTDLRGIGAQSVDEVCASHILEHIAWPMAFKALSEWRRVLRIGGWMRLAVPDLALLARMISEGRNVWHATGLLFGVGRLDNALEAHQYGYTRDMLLAMLRALGFGKFDWWKHDLADGSNGWMLDDGGGRVAISLNLAAQLTGDPVIDPGKLLTELQRDPMSAFDQILARAAGAAACEATPGGDADPVLIQRLHMALIEARMRIQFLESSPCMQGAGAERL